MQFFRGFQYALIALVLLAAGCTRPAQGEAKPAAVQPHARVATEPTPCDLYCADACNHVPEPACSYSTSNACLADCLPSCASGEVRAEVKACGGDRALAPGGKKH
jgi:hypothetical protein